MSVHTEITEPKLDLDLILYGQTQVQPILEEIRAELGRACTKFPQWPTDPLHAVTIVGEEYGELVKEMLQLVYEPHKTNKDRVHAEAIQCAAMVLRLLANLDRYEYRPGPQHTDTTLMRAAYGIHK